MKSTKLTALPDTLTWKNQPETLETNGVATLSMAAGPKTDWFYDPAGSKRSSNAPVALFCPARRELPAVGQSDSRLQRNL